MSCLMGSTQVCRGQPRGRRHPGPMLVIPGLGRTPFFVIDPRAVP